ncbi:MAG: type II toxin-antitoxin system RelB/DinJ family antitoxin [Kiritimatiellia bacterium]
MQTARTETVRARISPALKASAEGILASLGLNPSQAIVLFYRQIELRNGMPFDLRLPPKAMPDMATMTDDELTAEVHRGLASAKAGKSRPVSEARADFRRKHATWANTASR